MKKKTFAVLIASALTTPLSLAADFEGLALGVDLGMKSTGGELKTSDRDLDYGWKLGGDNEFVAGLNVSYGFALGPTMILRVGATYDFNDTDVESSTSSYSNIRGESDRTWTSVEESDHYSLYVAPGILLGERTLAYAKLAYHNMELSEKYSWVEYDTGGDVFDSYSSKGSEDFAGWGFGLGIETRVTSNICFSVEVQHVRYGSETMYGETGPGYVYQEKVEPDSTIGTFGLSYRF